MGKNVLNEHAVLSLGPMEAADLSKTLVNTYNILLCYNTDDDILFSKQVFKSVYKTCTPFWLGLRHSDSKITWYLQPINLR